MIDVYRGISGYGFLHENKWVHAGLNENLITKYGICNGNNSVSQNREARDDDPVHRKVYGLPVFLSQPEAEEWLTDKKIRCPVRGLGLLAIAHLDEGLIDSGEIEIYRNIGSTVNSADRLLSLEELIAHRDGQTEIRGECYIPNFPCEAMLSRTTFLVPSAHTLEGKIDTSIQNAFVNFADFQSTN